MLPIGSYDELRRMGYLGGPKPSDMPQRRSVSENDYEPSRVITTTIPAMEDLTKGQRKIAERIVAASERLGREHLASARRAAADAGVRDFSGVDNTLREIESDSGVKLRSRLHGGNLEMTLDFRTAIAAEREAKAAAKGHEVTDATRARMAHAHRAEFGYANVDHTRMAETRARMREQDDNQSGHFYINGSWVKRSAYIAEVRRSNNEAGKAMLREMGIKI